MRYYLILVVSVFLLEMNLSDATRRQRRSHPHCRMSVQIMRRNLVNPCRGEVLRAKHPHEPSNVCFLRNGQVLSSLQLMLETFHKGYRLNSLDRIILRHISLELPTSLETNTTRAYLEAMRQYYHQLSCLTIAMSRSDVSVEGHQRQQHLCNIVTKHIQPMLCTGQFLELDTDPSGLTCATWQGRDVKLYGRETMRQFLLLLTSLQPSCNTLVPMS